MRSPFVVDAHAHVGLLGRLPCREMSLAAHLERMDHLGIQFTICSDQEALSEGGRTGLDTVRRTYERSDGRIHGLGIFDPRSSDRCLGELRDTLGWQGLRGIKIHPTMQDTPAGDRTYEPVWQFAEEHDLAILAHTWSRSSHNPAQALSTPEQFEPFLRRFPEVRFVLGHAGGRGEGRIEAVRLARNYPNVYLDFAGDIFCRRLVETLVASVAAEKVLFGSDFPWTSPEAHLTRVLLAPIDEASKARILRHNAMDVFRIEAEACSQ